MPDEIMPTFEFPPDFNPGAFEDRIDERDRPYDELLMGAPIIDWDKGYNVEDELKKQFGVELNVEDQNGSLSCVGQAWSKYAEVLNIVETKGHTDLSAKSIYEQIFLPAGGAYLRDGAKVIVKGGVATEEDLPSYEIIMNTQGTAILAKNPPNEEFMRKPTITDAIREKMKVYKALEYRSIGSAQADLLAHAIMNNWGGVGGARGDNAGWRQYPVQKPQTPGGDWGHAFYWTGFGREERGRYFDFLNFWGKFWGKNGRGRMYFEEYDMPNNTFGIWTLVDLPNFNNNSTAMKTIKTDSSPHIYLVSADNKSKIKLADMATLNPLAQPETIVSQEEFDSYETKGSFVWVERNIE